MAAWCSYPYPFHPVLGPGLYLNSSPEVACKKTKKQTHVGNHPYQGSRNGAGNAPQLSPGFPLDSRSKVRSLHIVVADDDPAMMQFYREVLARLGHQVCVALTGRQVVEQCRLLRPDIAIVEANVPVLDGIAAADEICGDKPTPIILVPGNHDADLLQRALDNPYVLACLFKPLKEADIGPAIVVAMRRFEQFESCRKEAAAARSDGIPTSRDFVIPGRNA